MKKQRPLLLLLLAAYIFAPTFFNWVIKPEGGWYRPYIIWLIVVVVAYLLQDKKQPQD